MAYKVFIGSTSEYFKWDGTNISWKGANTELSDAGALTCSSGTIGGWSIASGSISSGNITLVSGANPAIELGSATHHMTGTGIWMGDDSGTYKLHIGNPSGDYLNWDGTNLEFTGTGTLIAGSDIGSTVANTFTINSDGEDATITLVLKNDTDGDVDLEWSGTAFTIDIGGTDAIQFNTSGQIVHGSSACILDEDDLTSDSDLHLATQQSIKAYVDDEVGAIGDPTGTSNDSFEINSDNDDVTVQLIFGRTTGGDGTISYGGSSFEFDNYIVVDTGATPSNNHILCTANDSGAWGVLAYAADNIQMYFDARFTGGTLYAEDTSAARISKISDSLIFYGDTGLTADLAWTTPTVMGRFDLSNGFFALGTAAPSTKLHVVSTTEQLRLGYDATDYISFTVASGGGTTINLSTGTTLLLTGQVFKVKHATTPSVQVEDTTNTVIGTLQGTDSNAWVGASSNHDFIVKANNTNVITCKTDGNIHYYKTAFEIAADTSDASDTKSLLLAGGGSYGVSRGSSVRLYGNEHATAAGDVYVYMGASSSNGLIIGDGTGANIFQIATTGDVTMSSGMLTITNAGTENLRLAYDGSEYQSFTVSSAGNITLSGTGAWWKLEDHQLILTHSSGGQILHLNDSGAASANEAVLYIDFTWGALPGTRIGYVGPSSGTNDNFNIVSSLDNLVLYGANTRMVDITSAAVGVGETSPDEILHVTGGTQVSDPPNVRIQAKTQTSSDYGEVYCGLEFGVSGGTNSAGAQEITARIDCVDFRTGVTSYDDGGLMFSILGSGDAAPYGVMCITNFGDVHVGEYFCTTARTSRKLAVLDSGTQLGLFYDISNYCDFTISSGGNLTVAPTGDFVFNPTGNDILPTTNYDLNLGSLSKKYLTLHAAELWVETLVAQDTIATIGGRILVGPTTILTSDLDAVSTTIYVEHNQMSSGDRVYMEANGKVEFMSIDSAPGGVGPYSYTVTRNLDGSGANVWYAGDAVFNTGTTGNGFMDLYSYSGVDASGSTTGPTIVGNVRDSATYNDWTEHWAIGNLDGLYGYGTDTYGAGFGEYGGDYVTIDQTNGIRMWADGNLRVDIDPSGTLDIGNVGSYPRMSYDGTDLFIYESADDYFWVDVGTAFKIVSGGNTRTQFNTDGSGWLAGDGKLNWDTSGNITMTGSITITDNLGAGLQLGDPVFSESFDNYTSASDMTTNGGWVDGGTVGSTISFPLGYKNIGRCFDSDDAGTDANRPYYYREFSYVESAVIRFYLRDNNVTGDYYPCELYDSTNTDWRVRVRIINGNVEVYDGVSLTDTTEDMTSGQWHEFIIYNDAQNDQWYLWFDSTEYGPYGHYDVSSSGEFNRWYVVGLTGLGDDSDFSLDNCQVYSTEHFLADRIIDGLDTSGTLITSVEPGTAIGTPSAAGLYLGSDIMGYYDNSSWDTSTWIKNDGTFQFYGDSSSSIDWDGTTLTISGDISVGSMAAIPDDEDLVAYWSLDDGDGEVAYDHTGGGNDGDLIGLGTSWAGTGKSKDSILLDNTTYHSHIDLPDDIINVSTATFSVSLWIYPSVLPSAMNSTRPRFFGLVGTSKFQITAIDNDTIAARISDSGDIEQDREEVAYNWAVDTWVHIVVVCSGGNSIDHIYVDGTDTAFGTATSFSGTPSSSIGSGLGANLYAWFGGIDEVRIYDRELTAEEVKGLYTNPGGLRGTLITGNSIRTGAIRSTNWAAAAGVEFDLDSERLRLGGQGVTAAGDATGIFLGLDSADYKVWIGDADDGYIKWDGTDLTIKGQVTFEPGTTGIANTDAGAVALADTMDDIADGSTYSRPTVSQLAELDITTTWIAAGTTLINGGLIQTNTILADQIYVDYLSALTADLGTITSGDLIGANIWTSQEGDYVHISDKGIELVQQTTTAQYGDFLYAEAKYGSGVLAYIHNTERNVPFYIESETNYGDFHFYPRTAAPASGTHEVGDVIVADGKLMLCTSAGSPGTWTNVSHIDADDTTAIHTDESGEIVAVTEKTAPVGNDEIIIEDSAASNAKKSVKLSNLPYPIDDTDDIGITESGGTLELNDNVAVLVYKNSTGGGTATTGAWYTRPLDEELHDPNGWCSIASNQFTLAAGTYHIVMYCSFFRCSETNCRLYDVTNTAYYYCFTSGYFSQAYYVGAALVGVQDVQPTGSTTYAIQYRCGATKADDGLGCDPTYSDQCHTIVHITRIK